MSASRFIAAGLATISISGAGIGIGLVFSGFITAFAKNPEFENKLFTYALLGFALTEAIALFGLMIAFLILFAL
jgi:F-type H+-transporting ATPase subunit c